MTDIEEIINGIDLLKPIPPVATQIMALAEDPDSSMAQIADLILYDPALTANLLKMCNSAYFALSRKVESVKDAVTLLGLDHIVELVLLNSLSEILRIEEQGYGLGEGELWHHAVSSAHVAKILAEKKGLFESKHFVFTAALLKDIGKLILGRFVAFSLEKINILVHSQGYSFNEAEKQVIGMSHEELGAMVAERWRFSEKMIYVIRHHHLLDESAREDIETAIVYLSDIICMMTGIGTGADGLAYRFYSDVLNRMALTEKDLQAVIAETIDRREMIQKLLDLF